MNDQVEQVKQKVDIVEIIGERVALKKAGRHFKGLCPFHSEKSPSFIVSPERQSFKCFGCQEGGDVISFLQKYDGYSFLEALELLAKRVGITLESYRPSSQDTYRRRLQEILSLASEYYQYLLAKHERGEEAREYLKSRGIGGEAISQFYLGFAPNQWRSVSDYLVKKKGYGEEELLAVGLTIRSEAGRYYDRFRGRIMFPLKDHKGVGVGFSGRTLSKETTEAKYINSPETILYSKSRMLYGLWENREYIRKEKTIVLVEGELDVIPSWQAGVRHVVAIKGSAFTEGQAQLMARYCPNVIMSLDADPAGQEAIKRAVIVAEQLDLSIRVVQITEGKDPGEVATSNPRRWREMIKGSVLFWDYLIESACRANDAKTGIGAKNIAAEVIPALSQITNSVVRAHYVSELAKRLSVPEESIYSEIERSIKRKTLNSLKQTIGGIEGGRMGRREEVEKYALSLVLQFYPKIGIHLGKLKVGWLETAGVAKIFEQLQAWEAKSEFKIQAFSLSLPAELQPTVDETYLKDLSETIDPEREWGKIVGEIKEMYVRDELKKLTQAITMAEKKGDPIEELQAKFASLSGILRLE
ncbi:MAG: primase protein [Microgenomates group bacterium GW2011_GWA2_46_7]|nr:MAG: primase protein [Microgenomates group bacterium GW2011_GWA2_46_7]